jgi:PPOX class probable F420-dependent enzyme
MTSRRDLIRMTSAEVRAYLREMKQLTVATLLPDGSPHLVAMSFALVDGAPTFVSYAKSQKVRNLRRDPRMSILASSGERYADYRGVQMTGTGELVEDTEAVLALMQQIAAKTRVLEPVTAGIFPEELKAQAPKRVGVIFRPQRCASWDHRKLGGRY